MLLTIPSLGQDWKSFYEEAVKQYQSQQYASALNNARQAYTLSKSLDLKNQAYTLQLMTAICVENGQADEGLKWIGEEETLYQKIEGPASKTYAEALRKHSLLLQQKGSYKEAEEKCESALKVLKESQNEKSQSYAVLLAFYGQLAAANGEMSKAREILNQSLDQLSAFPDAHEEYVNALSLSAGMDKQMNDLVSAEKKYRLLIDLLERNNQQSSPDYGLAKSALIEILLANGDKAERRQLLLSNAVTPEQKALQYLKIAIDDQNNHQLMDALGEYQLALQAAGEAKLENSTAFSIHLNYGRVLVELNRLEEASKEISLAQDHSMKLYPPGSSEHAFVFFASGDLDIARGNIRNAVEYYQKAFSSSSKMTPSIRIHWLTNASRQLLNHNQSDAAVTLLQPLMADLYSLPEKEMAEAAFAYGEALIESNQNDQAISFLSKSSYYASSIEIKNQYELETAEAWEQKGDWKKALELLFAATSRPLLKEDLKGENFYQIGRLQQRLGTFEEAEKSFRKSIEYYLKFQPDHTESLLQVYNSLAILYTQLGNYEEAERLYLDILNEKDSLSGFYTTLRQNLAAVYEESLRYDEAKKILEGVVEEERQRLGEHHPDFAISLQNLAVVYEKTGQLASAKGLFTQALQVDKEILGENSLSYATKAANLGIVYQQMGDLAKARGLFESALKIREIKLGKDHPDYVFNEYNLAVLLQEMHEPEKAYPLFKHASTFYVSQINELFPAMSEKEKTAFYNKISEVVLAYQDFAIENGNKQKDLIGELYNFRLATKALLLNASTKVRNRILASGDSVLLQHFAEWLHVKEDLGKLNALNSEEKALNAIKIQSLRQKANELEKYLSAQSELFARDNYNEMVTWQKVRASLGPGQAAIEMIRLRLNLKNDSVIYAALVIKPDLPGPELVIFPNGRHMEKREFNYYRNSIIFQTKNDRSYGIYWKSLEGLLKDVKTIYLSSDGVYNKVNVMTLYNPETKQYLIEQQTIKLTTNTRELVTRPKTSITSQTASLFGHPDFKLGSTITADGLSAEATRNFTPAAQAIVSNGIPDLPGTKEEVNKIVEILRSNKWKTSLYLGSKATESAIKAQQNTGVLHIATHGFFISSQDDGGPVVLTRDLARAENNPLLSCGLILSGAEKYLLESAVDKKRKFSEDGILTAYEALNLNLDHSLVVLSACETGAGEIRNGEGVYGLQRAFLLAGADNLIMSLWKVDDEATQELMVEFYNQWNKNKNTAFRSAQLVMKTKFTEPYYWGSFVMIGHN